MNADLVRVSKRLSAVLRHRPASVGLALDPQGWVDVDTLLAALAAHSRPVSRDDLDAVVSGNDKRRFAVSVGADGRERIRASQGHSVPVALGLADRQPPAVLFHGTSAGAVPSILRTGLVKGRRHAVHLSADVRTAQVVGARRSGPVALLEVDAAAMAGSGHRFQRSANGVWLTEHVPPTFIRRLDARPPDA
ncbi:RNA 2'-phosphotransferase [Asanoa iriomotensis]|uniref:Probable RNA 2'-phosphotransferase n=1 Tax=Asanoa iriomotensis TaxID=234613 RepID=A0ABQ4C6V1_9ACTN|nr:RNA 2'-phosphotransferase [Asanoa iriomotensis]GIF58479.1 putative RNA 2'-phosphotransferase [Asanoa iriomotensis]